MRRFGILLSGLFALAGCGRDGPPLVEVTGTLRLNQQPLPGATITFVPTQPGGSAAYGMTDDDGEYRLKFSRDRYGAMPGPNKVTVALPSKRESEALREAGMAAPPDDVELPQKYTVPGELTADVPEEGGQFDFDLQSSPEDQVTKADGKRRRNRN